MSLDFALHEARAMWPDTVSWEIIASDLEVIRTAETHPLVMDQTPGAIMSLRGRILRQRHQMAIFRTE